MNGNEWNPTHFDEWGNEYELTESGARRVPMTTKNKTVTNGFTTYDTEQGHCGFCGKLTCNGSCFK